MKSANKILAVPFLAAALAASGGASAQAYGAPYGAPVTSAVTTGGYYDYARVVRVVPMVGARDGYDRDSLRALRDGGFDMCCSTRKGRVVAGTSRYQVPRFGVVDTDGDAFEANLRRWLAL